MNVANVMSSNRQDWETPQYILNYLRDQKGYHFTLDPCSNVANHKFAKFYTVDDNGLSQNWQNEVVFVNPPYIESAAWIEKCYNEWHTNNTIVVMLIASRTDTKAWYNYVSKAPAIEFLIPRVKFELNGQSVGSPTFGSALVYFDNNNHTGVKWVKITNK